MLYTETHFYSLLNYHDAMSVMSRVCMARADLLLSCDSGPDWDDAREIEESTDDWTEGVASTLNEMCTAHWFTAREVLDELETYYSAGEHARGLLAGRLYKV